MTGQGAPDPREEVDRLRGEIERLANLAAEHLACSGCPTPWWLNNWLLAVASDSTIQPDTAAPDAAAPKEAGG